MNENIKKPNFFIIGAPKCGTTAMARYLGEHPDVFFSSPKEIHYFNTDFLNKRKKITEKVYLEKFFKGSENFKAVGEGSVWYLYSEEAVPNILKFNPKARFIVMVRNPISMFHSRFHQSLINSWENVKTPMEAWNLQWERKKSKSIPPFCRDKKTLFYGEVCSLGEQLGRLYDLVPKSQVLVLFFDDLKKDTRGAYKKTLDFLELPDDGREHFPKVNVRKKLKSKNFKYFVEFIRKLKYKSNIKKNFGLHSRLKELEKKKNRKGVKDIEPLPDDLKRELLEYFDKDIDKLAELTGRDLSHWKEI